VSASLSLSVAWHTVQPAMAAAATAALPPALPPRLATDLCQRLIKATSNQVFRWLFFDHQKRRIPPMTRFPLVALGVSTLLLQACVLAPGMHMDTDRLVSQDYAENSMVEMVQITPKLIAQDLAVKSQAAVPPALLDYVPENYRIGPNDALFITVWDHPELTIPGGQQQPSSANARVVRDDGTLFYPFIGSVQVAGKTLEELREIIATRLARY